jgi:predicted HAD superfamily Cof-like phosphohydrolase
MYSPVKDIATFMNACGQEVPEDPTIPEDKVVYLRCKLIAEEAFETLKAAGYRIVVNAPHENERGQKIVDHKNIELEKIAEPNLPEVAKELSDLNYVSYGTGVAFGIDLQRVHVEVQRSNMTKVGKDGKVTKNEYGKVVKPHTYEPADIDTVLAKQGWKHN